MHMHTHTSTSYSDNSLYFSTERITTIYHYVTDDNSTYPLRLKKNKNPKPKILIFYNLLQNI